MARREEEGGGRIVGGGRMGEVVVDVGRRIVRKDRREGFLKKIFPKKGRGGEWTQSPAYPTHEDVFQADRFSICFQILHDSIVLDFFSLSSFDWDRTPPVPSFLRGYSLLVHLVFRGALSPPPQWRPVSPGWRT